MSNAILFRMQSGIAGAVSRESKADIEAQAVASATPFPFFGMPGKVVGGIFVPLTVVGDTSPYGILVRPYPTQGQNASDPLGTAVPPQGNGIANILRRGYISVQLNAGAGSAALGSPVYFRYANPSGAAIVGGLEGASVASTTVALANAVFMGPADANGIAEIGFNI